MNEYLGLYFLKEYPLFHNLSPLQMFLTSQRRHQMRSFSGLNFDRKERGGEGSGAEGRTGERRKLIGHVETWHLSQLPTLSWNLWTKRRKHKLETSGTDFKTRKCKRWIRTYSLEDAQRHVNNSGRKTRNKIRLYTLNNLVPHQRCPNNWNFDSSLWAKIKLTKGSGVNQELTQNQGDRRVLWICTDRATVPRRVTNNRSVIQKIFTSIMPFKAAATA